MNFSINFPTRGRVPFVTMLLRSIKENTSDIDSVEINIAYDTDDAAFEEAIGSLRGLFPRMNVNYHPMERSKNIIAGYQNPLARLSTGKYLIMLCDDTEFATEGWDAQVIEKIKGAGFEDQMFYGWLGDGLIADLPYTCFPLVPKKFVDIVGGIFDERCFAWGADVRLGMLFERYGNILNLKDIEVYHNSYHTLQRPIDATGQRIIDINSEHPNYDDEKWIEEVLSKLRAANDN